MTLPFSGPGTRIGPEDLSAAARRLAVPLPRIVAVVLVETGGAAGFLMDGTRRPRILFEAHIFSKHTGHAFDDSHPDISSAVWNRALYIGGAGEYGRLAKAVTLDREAALKAASWGLFQVLGENWEWLGYPSVEDFVAAQVAGEAGQLDAFVRFVEKRGLAQSLRDGDYDYFASRYNGTGYRQNDYAGKMRRAEQTALNLGTDGILRAGARGTAVKRLQTRLVFLGWRQILVDGVYGRITEIAVQQFQDQHGLEADGIAGPRTLAALHEALAAAGFQDQQGVHEAGPPKGGRTIQASASLSPTPHARRMLQPEPTADDLNARELDRIQQGAPA